MLFARVGFEDVRNSGFALSFRDADASNKEKDSDSRNRMTELEESVRKKKQNRADSVHCYPTLANIA